MPNQLKPDVAKEENKRLASNVFSLTLLQGANYLLPLLTIPYLVRVLGPEFFGLLAFATATIGFFMLITDYGFNLSATRQISIHRDDATKVNEIFSAVMTIKVILMFFSFVLLAALVFSFEKFSQYWQVYFLTFGMVIGQVLFPVWFFQGMERMKYISYLNIAAKAFFAGCIFIFVQSQSDYLWVPLLTSMGFVVAGLYSLYLLKIKFTVHFYKPSFAHIQFQLREGWHVFFSSMSISLYTIAIPFMLGILTNNVLVGYFSAADKIVQAVKGLFQPVSQAMYPLISKKIQEDRQSGLAFVKKMRWLVGTCMFFVSGLLFVFAQQIVYSVLGEAYYSSILLLQIMAFVPFVVALSNMYGIQTMLNLGYEKAFSRILLVAAVLGVVLGMGLSSLFGAEGAAWTMLVVEVMVTLMMWVFLRKVVHAI